MRERAIMKTDASMKECGSRPSARPRYSVRMVSWDLSRMGEIFSSKICRGWEKFSLATNDDDVGGMSSTWRASSANFRTQADQDPTCTLSMVRVDGSPTKSGDGAWNIVGFQVSKKALETQTFDETTFVQSIGMNVHLWSFCS